MHQLNSILKKEIIWEMLSNLTYILIICSNLKKERLDHAVSSTYDIDSINANDCVLGYPSWQKWNMSLSLFNTSTCICQQC